MSAPPYQAMRQPSTVRYEWRHWFLLAGICIASTAGLSLALFAHLHGDGSPGWPWQHTDTALVSALLLLVLLFVTSLTLQQRRFLAISVRNAVLEDEVALRERLHGEFAARNQDLEEQVAQRTAALQAQATQMLKLYRMAYDFVGNVSHEFRTPLTVIKEYVSALEEALEVAQLDAETRRFFEVLHARVDDLSLMVDDLIDVTRLESDIVRISRRPCRIEAIATRVQETVAPKARKCEVVVEFMADEGLPDLFCDPDKIARVLINLVVNALKFSPPGRVVRMWALHDIDDGLVRIGVTDHGPGIPRESRELVFERFKQTAPAEAMQPKGFGLGLHIAKELVALNFGDMTLHSSMGIGSVFSFSVPTWNPETLLHHYLQHVAYFRQASATVSLLRVDASEGPLQAGKTAPKRAAGETPADEPRKQTETNGRAGDLLGLFLEERLRRTDLLVRAGPATWVMVVATGQDLGLANLIQRLEEEHEKVNLVRRHQPLPSLRFRILGTWSAATRAPLASAFVAALRRRDAAHSSSRLDPAPASSGSIDTCT